MTATRRASVLAGVVSAAVLIAAAQPANALSSDAQAAESSAAAVTEATGTEGVVTTTPSTDSDTAAAVSTAAGTVVDIPLTTEGVISVGAGDHAVEIGLPETTDNSAVRDASGTVVYADESEPVDVAVQPTEEGVRALVVIKDETAPKEYRFPIDGPEGSRLVTSAELLGEENDTGEVLLLDAEGTALGLFDAAWAKDANGQPVETSYRVEGNTLVQTVDTNEDTAFPVVADPNWWSIAACAGALAWFVGSNIVVISKIIKVKQYINALGGFRASAKLMLRASNWEERLRIGGGALVGLAAEVLGVTAIRRNCT